MILGVKKSKKWKMTPPPTIKHGRVTPLENTYVKMSILNCPLVRFVNLYILCQFVQKTCRRRNFSFKVSGKTEFV